MAWRFKGWGQVGGGTKLVRGRGLWKGGVVSEERRLGEPWEGERRGYSNAPQS